MLTISRSDIYEVRVYFKRQITNSSSVEFYQQSAVTVRPTEARRLSRISWVVLPRYISCRVFDDGRQNMYLSKRSDQVKCSRRGRLASSTACAVDGNSFSPGAKACSQLLMANKTPTQCSARSEPVASVSQTARPSMPCVYTLLCMMRTTRLNAYVYCIFSVLGACAGKSCCPRDPPLTTLDIVRLPLPNAVC